MALNRNIYKKVRDAFEHKCFRLIIGAYEVSLDGKTIQLDWNENDISSELQRHMKENPLRIKWNVSTNIESPIPKDTPKIKGFSNKYPRIDFRFQTIISLLEYEYFFEAKNLKQSDSALKRRYIDTGIDNFVNKKYVNGSIIGYILEGDAVETVVDINSLLKKDKRGNEILCLQSNELLKTYYESNHSSIGVLKHLIFDYTSISNQ